MDAGTDAGMDELAAAAVALVGDRRRVVLGIAGAPGAGKSTLAEALVEAVACPEGDGWVAHVPMDGFHLADAQLDRLGLRSRKGAPDTFDADGYAALLRRLVESPTRGSTRPGFERTLEQPIAAADGRAPGGPARRDRGQLPAAARGAMGAGPGPARRGLVRLG